MGESLPESDIRELVKWLLRLRRRYRVSGASMIPLLKPGEEVLVDQRAYRKEDPNPGDIVVAFHPNNKGFKIIKRVSTTYADGSCDLQGENLDESTDFSNVGHNQILGRVTSKFP